MKPSGKFRTKIMAQDRILAAIVEAAKTAPFPEVAEAIRAEGTKLADRWGVVHPNLSDTRRDAAS